jgi:FkbM family methyltransferase
MVLTVLGQARATLGYIWRHPLNARARMAAVARALHWQLRSRLLPGPFVLRFVDDVRLLAMRGEVGVTGNWYCGLHEPAEMAFVLHALRSGELFVDIGANSGSFALLAAGAAGARVLAIEPVPETCERLLANVGLNDLADRVRCIPIALSDAQGSVRMTSSLDSCNHVLEGTQGTGVAVAATTLDALLSGEVPTIVKIDVEGYEPAVLRGSARTLADDRLQAVIVETLGLSGRYGWNDGQTDACLRAAGLVPWRYDPLARRLEPGRGAGNAIYLRDAAWAQQRVTQARRFRLINGWI